MVFCCATPPFVTKPGSAVSWLSEWHFEDKLPETHKRKWWRTPAGLIVPREHIKEVRRKLFVLLSLVVALDPGSPGLVQS